MYRLFIFACCFWTLTSFGSTNVVVSGNISFSAAGPAMGFVPRDFFGDVPLTSLSIRTTSFLGGTWYLRRESDGTLLSTSGGLIVLRPTDAQWEYRVSLSNTVVASTCYFIGTYNDTNSVPVSRPVSEGNITKWSIKGFAVGISVLGTLFFVRWLLRYFGGLAKIPTSGN